jgi:hypothetical protein
MEPNQEGNGELDSDKKCTRVRPRYDELKSVKNKARDGESEFAELRRKSDRRRKTLKKTDLLDQYSRSPSFAQIEKDGLPASLDCNLGHSRL